VFKICQAHDDAKKNPPETPVFPDLEALTEAKMAEWARAARFHRNGGDVSLVHSATLAEQVALTLMQQNPDLTAAEALGRVKTTVRRLRQDLQHEIELSQSVPEPEPEESPPCEPSPELHGDREYSIISFFLCGYDHSGSFCVYHAYNAELSTSSTCSLITECFFSIASTDCCDSALAYCSLCASYSTT
jgi:hypothetical protein